MKSVGLSEDNLPPRPIFRNRSPFQSYTFLNQRYNELLTVNRWLMNFESKLSGSASAFSECRSEDPADQVLNPVKNLAPSPFVQSSLLSLVWWNKNTTFKVYQSSFLDGLNQLLIMHCYQHLLIKLFRIFLASVLDYRYHKHIIIRVINKNEYSKQPQIHHYSSIIEIETDKLSTLKNWKAGNLSFWSEKTNEKQNIQEGNNATNQEHYNGGWFWIDILSHHFWRWGQVNL